MPKLNAFYEMGAPLEPMAVAYFYEMSWLASKWNWDYLMTHYPIHAKDTANVSLITILIQSGNLVMTTTFSSKMEPQSGPAIDTTIIS